MKKINKSLHRIPADLRLALNSTEAINSAWDGLTPLGRNEWICWIISAKTAKTRKDRIERGIKEISEGKRRPCCWAGCPHRNK